MTYWAYQCRKPYTQAPTLLILDEWEAQKTDTLMDIYRLECCTTSVLVPAGCTTLVQLFLYSMHLLKEKLMTSPLNICKNI